MFYVLRATDLERVLICAKIELIKERILIMHSRIFQVSKVPIEPSQYIQAFDIPDSFTTGIADYVADVDDRQGELEWFEESLEGLVKRDPTKDSFRVLPDGREAYFRPSYQRFKEICALMQTLTLEAFIGLEKGPERKPMDLYMYKLNEAYTDKYGFYIYEEDTLMPLGEWLRWVDLEEDYYFGNVLDYHF